jgi:hypothetical protein
MQGDSESMFELFYFILFYCKSEFLFRYAYSYGTEVVTQDAAYYEQTF